MNFLADRKDVVLCPDCKYWQITPDDLSRGVCRLRAPVVNMVQTTRGLQMIASQPTTERTVGCAEGVMKVVLQ